MFDIIPPEEIQTSEILGYDRTKAEIMKRLQHSAFHGGLPGK